MKLSRIALICILALSAALLSCSRCPGDPGVHCDKANGFHITFPVDWTVDSDPGGGRVVAAHAPLEEGADPEITGTAFEVLVMRMQSDPDLDRFFDGYIKRLPEGKAYYEYEDSGEIKVGGRKTRYILYVIDTEPRYEATGYWRGPCWPQLAYLIWLALARGGEDDVAAEVAAATVAGASASGLAEYWDADSGEGLGAVPQSWAGLALLMVD